MEFKGLDVFQPLPMLKSDVRSDLGIRDFGKTNTHTICYVESLADSNKENGDRPESSRIMPPSRLNFLAMRRTRFTASMVVSGVRMSVSISSSSLSPSQGCLYSDPLISSGVYWNQVQHILLMRLENAREMSQIQYFSM